jgi:hypothetical protein
VGFGEFILLRACSFFKSHQIWDSYDFQLFLRLLDIDRFEGRYREGIHKIDASGLIRRLVKEELKKLDGTPLFPERRAYTIGYTLSELEALLYEKVTSYVRDEFNL